MSTALRWTVAVVAAIALVLGIAGAAIVPLLRSLQDGGSASYSLPAPQEGSQEPPAPELARFYQQELDWSACEDAWCATLTVPLDYADPAGETIELALLSEPATGDRQGALVVNPGGPGAPGTDYAASADQAFGEPLRESFDVVGFDPRGTGESAPVDCLSDADLDAYIAGDPNPDTPAEAAEAAVAGERFVHGCARHSGALVDHVSTVETVRDLDVLRAALGEDALDYYGASYGTKIGATYADLFPERAGQLVLDGALDPSLSSRETSLEQAAGFETALRSYVEWCLAEDDCPLEGSVDEGLQQIRDLMDSVDAEPLPTSGSRELEGGNAFYGLVTPLYAQQSWPALTIALEEAFDGDGTTLLALSDIYSSRGATGYKDNSSEAIRVISCLDDPWAIPPRQVPAQVPDFERASPTFGDVFAWSLTACRGFPGKAAEPPPEVTGAGAPPVLVVGTTRDPATPYQWAEALADQLESGVLLTRDGDGHTGYGMGNACVDVTIEDFLIDGVVPDDGLRC
ncbi:alpha/beta hydrolase [Nocardioides insulae]|uniref:alpha/beta hydrolase n=1 Tax=Nocardioides insulae TaxID=394734 RepID=UPI0003F4F2D1|nr:alpha/beta hydrolase [Nocardioides insulae]